MSNQTKQHGFTLIEIVITVVMLMGIGAAGYYAYKNVSVTKPVSSHVVKSSSTPSPKLAGSKLTAGPTSAWNTYTNYDYGFSIHIPAQILSTSACTTSSYVYNDYGQPVPSQTSDSTTEGAMPTTVLSSSGTFYATAQTTYVLSQPSYDGIGHTFFGACQKEENSVQIVQEYIKAETGVEVSVLQFYVVDGVKTSQLLSGVQQILGKGVSSATAAADASGNFENVTCSTQCGNYTDSAGAFGCPIGCSGNIVHYFPKSELLVAFHVGQAVNLMAADNKTIYDGAIISSFAPLSP